MFTKRYGKYEANELMKQMYGKVNNFKYLGVVARN